MTFQQLLLMCVIAVSASVVTAQQKKVDVSTKYITTSVSTLSPGDTKTFIATLCQQFTGQTVNATILLNNNPTWDTKIGVIYYYIVDDPKKTKKDALCNNTDNTTGKTGPYCIIPKWTSTNDLYLIAVPGDVAAISFTVDVDMKPPSTRSIKKEPNQRKTYESFYKKPFNSSHQPKATEEYLTEIVLAETNQRLTYLTEALLEVTYCPNSFTTDQYKITSTVFGTDGISSYAQYICEKLPCEVDGPNVLPQSNGKQLPANDVVLTTASGQFAHIYVLIVCWGGQFDPAVGNYVGQFQYSGSLTRSP